ncbi:Nn.00g072380.m01.CDS01 [Neocucurbitaria sp. VM-36]
MPVSERRILVFFSKEPSRNCQPCQTFDHKPCTAPCSSQGDYSNKQLQSTTRTDDKLSIVLQQIEHPEALLDIPSGSGEDLQRPLDTTTTLSKKSDISSTNDDSTTSIGCSVSSTIATEVNSKARSGPRRSQVSNLKPSAQASLLERAQHDRDFAPLRAIPDELLKSQLLKHVDRFNDLTTKHCRIQRRTEGANHHVVILEIGPVSLGHEYVIKIPVTGTKERWTKKYAHTIQCEAILMWNLKKCTSIPVPEMISYENNIENELGAPYILMRKLDGKTAYNVGSMKATSKAIMRTVRLSTR